MYFLPHVNRTPKNGYNGKFCYIYFTTIGGKKRQTHKEEQEKIATEFWKLEILLGAGRPEKAQLQASDEEKQRTTLISSKESCRGSGSAASG